jgi:Fe-S-cluster containining protein
MELDYRAAKREAEAKLKTIIKELPNELSERENRIFNKISTSQESPFSKLERIYCFLDDFLSFVSLYIPCHEGCSNCCHLKVSVSTIEADYIQDKTGIKQTLSMESKGLFGTSCPFLKKEACSIYKYRPYVCRRYVAIFSDPKWCNLDLCGLYSFPSIRFTEVEKSFDFLVASGGGGYYLDIRQLFNYSKIA